MARYKRSVLSAEAVMELVGGSYGLEVTGCRLIRSLVNDVYEIDEVQAASHSSCTSSRSAQPSLRPGILPP